MTHIAFLIQKIIRCFHVIFNYFKEFIEFYPSNFLSFLVIACKPAFPSYLAALNPTDQVFDFEELEYHYQVANRTEDCTTKDNDSGNEDENNEDGNKDKENPKNEEASPIAAVTANTTANTSTAGSTTLTNIMSGNDANNQANIDNPYLRAATIPKKG